MSIDKSLHLSLLFVQKRSFENEKGMQISFYNHNVQGSWHFCKNEHHFQFKNHISISVEENILIRIVKTSHMKLQRSATNVSKTSLHLSYSHSSNNLLVKISTCFMLNVIHCVSSCSKCGISHFVAHHKLLHILFATKQAKTVLCSYHFVGLQYDKA